MKSLPVLSTGLELGLGTKTAAAGFNRIMIVVRLLVSKLPEMDLRDAGTHEDIGSASKPYET